jgi:hypothetical protein
MVRRENCRTARKAVTNVTLRTVFDKGVRIDTDVDGVSSEEA